MSVEESVVEPVVDQVAERVNRLAKLENFKKAGVHPYPARFDKQIDLAQARELPLEAPVKTAGRIVLFRQMGSITFAHLQDFSGRMQVVFKKEKMLNEWWIICKAKATRHIF